MVAPYFCSVPLRELDLVADIGLYRDLFGLNRGFTSFEIQDLSAHHITFYFVATEGSG